MPESMQALAIALFCLPGFVGYSVFSRLYCREIEQAFDKVSWIFLINILSISVLGQFRSVPFLNLLPEGKFFAYGIAFFINQLLLPLSFIAALIGVFLSLVLSSSFIQGYLIKLKFTVKTRHGSVISDVIKNNPDAYFKIRFNNGGYVIGHPRKYSLHGDEQYLFLGNALRRPKRKSEADSQPPARQIDGPGVLILNFDNVECVEVI
jgi:hypothetical protein